MVARRHHYVPKCYLESFATKTSKKKKSSLWVFDAVDKKSFKTAPDNIALQTDFNTINLEGPRAGRVRECDGKRREQA